MKCWTDRGENLQHGLSLRVVSCVMLQLLVLPWQMWLTGMRHSHTKSDDQVWWLHPIFL
jgi:hypothetical protein